MTTKTITTAGAEFELADQDRVEALQAQIDRIVEAFGHEPCHVLTTDESTISDIAKYDIVGPCEWRVTPRSNGQKRRCYPASSRRLDEEHFAAACAKLGLVIDEGELVVDVALRLRQLVGA